MNFCVHAHFFRYTETEVTRPLYIVREWGGVLLRRVVGMGDQLIGVENLLTTANDCNFYRALQGKARGEMAKDSFVMYNEIRIQCLCSDQVSPWF